MKKLLTVVFLLAIVASTSFAQDTFNKGDKVGQIGLGFGLTGVYGDASLPPVTVGLQYAFHEKISVGGIVGYTSSSQDYYFGKYTYTYILIGARGEYHFLDKSKEWDLYAGATLGYAIVSNSYKSNGGYDWYTSSSASGSYAIEGIHGGAKYYFSPKFAVFGEVGYGMGYLTIGAAYKF